MQVRRDFDQIYKIETDPWNIGSADSDRYNLYFDLINRFSHSKRTILDIGCGFGAFLARFRSSFEKTIGVEVSRDAILKGKKRFPFITYIKGSADDLAKVIETTERYDTIVYSDVICYLDERGKNRSLKWIADHLEDGGLAFIAAWCPGGKYLTESELERLVKRFFKIEKKCALESGHAVFLGRRKKYFVAVTIDYETWHPIPPGEKINWEKDVFYSTEKLLELSAEEGIRMTLMTELGEYFWLCENNAQIARRMEKQWVEAIQRGHDVQIHLHPNWLPELGARCEHGEWKWDWLKAKANDYPGDLTVLITKCKTALESVIGEKETDYRVTSFRAGAYQVQPFKRLYDALVANGIFCDSSVYAGGVSAERGYDFSLVYSSHQPYYANSYDPQLKGPPAEQAMVEIPIFTVRPGERWSLDGTKGQAFSEEIFNYLRVEGGSFKTSESWRRTERARSYVGSFYQRLRPVRSYLNKFLPKAIAHFMTAYEPELLTGHEYFVLTGHTKGDHDFAQIGKNFRVLKKDNRFEFVTLSQMANEARQELVENSRPNAREEACYQVMREYETVMGESRNEAQSYYLQQTIPLDRNTVLDIGCGAGHWSARIVELYPWMTLTGLDYGVAFLLKARGSFNLERLSFVVGDFIDLPFCRESYDCVYADNILEHSFDINRTLQEIFRVLRWGGVLVAAIPSDARNTRRICDNHGWKTAPHEVKMRLEAAGLTNIEIEEIDVLRKFGMPPFPSSNDIMMYVKAWKRKARVFAEDRVLEMMDWVYRNLSPEKPQESNDPVEVISRGHAFCWGYAVVLGKLLEREGFHVKWATMLAKGHPKGRGKEKIDSHEVVELQIDGKEKILDPMTNTVIPYPLADVLSHPELVVEKKDQDTRYKEREYHLYDTSFWYSRVFRYAVRSKVDERFVRWRKNRIKKCPKDS